MSQPMILVVEDDVPIRRGLVDALKFNGYPVLESDNGRDALDLVVQNPVQLVLLDVMLPEMDGFETLDEVRKVTPGVPVIMVTARGSEEDRVRGLTHGADDYVVKPFSIRELVARVEAVLRRSPERPPEIRGMDCGDRRIDLERREVCWSDGTRTPLTEREAGILRHLAQSHGRAVDRKELLYRVWGMDPIGIQTRTVDMHIARLRDKLGKTPEHGDVILTVRGKGYMLAETVHPEMKAAAGETA